MKAVTIVAQHVGPVGGMERQLTEVITGLVATGWDVTVVARKCDLGGLQGVRHVRVRGPYRPAALGFPWFFFAAGVLTKLRGRGLVHTNGAIMWAPADVATVHFCHRAFQATGDGRRGSKTSLLYRVNSSVTRRVNALAESWCMRPTRVQRLIGISPGVAREAWKYYGFPPERIHVIPYGVDHARFAPNAEGGAHFRRRNGLASKDLVAIFVGGEWLRKGLRHAIDALVEAREWRLVVVGPGDPRPFEEHAQKACVQERVTFVGPDPHPELAYAAADAFVFPTGYETFSLVAHEAAAAGLPLLATRTNGIEDLIRPGENGSFIEQDGADIARRLNELSDPQRRERYGRAARLTATQYSWAGARNAHLALYDDIVQGAAST
jgi:glycosyltransferase involved in cell wall biosynthesis